MEPKISDTGIDFLVLGLNLIDVLTKHSKEDPESIKNTMDNLWIRLSSEEKSYLRHRLEREYEAACETSDSWR